jgi:putative ubiquitin-RnfH superfamily antitoxin RatB of RatAB toxin-antitoxin module
MLSCAAPMRSMAELRIEIVYALAQTQTVLRLVLAPGATVKDAVERSGILQRLPPAAALNYGIFGRRVSADQRLTDGDRIEIYRPLQADPREARRARANARRMRS